MDTPSIKLGARRAKSHEVERTALPTPKIQGRRDKMRTWSVCCFDRFGCFGFSRPQILALFSPLVIKMGRQAQKEKKKK